MIEARALDKVADPQLLAKMGVGATETVRNLFDSNNFVKGLLHGVLPATSMR